MAPNENLHHINITSLRIDDLYILLNGLVPNFEILGVRLCQPCLLITSDVKYTHYVNHVKITTEDEMLEIKEKFHRARQLTTCLSINIKLPRQISKLILSSETPT
ncbi:unnamed protein product [Rotaria socialis]|uniref:Uncharacterized protein n=1 Tax=Rotaria socialis TaxID=392032 RepID=A0A818K0M2_9BILA|nr:unnamed protein product [Rotaria socialis]